MAVNYEHRHQSHTVTLDGIDSVDAAWLWARAVYLAEVPDSAYDIEIGIYSQGGSQDNPHRYAVVNWRTSQGEDARP